MSEHSAFITYTDGGARGNPGPAALGVVICDGRGNVLKKYGEYLGEVTNNEAEYRAAIFALKKLKALIGKEKAKKSDVHMRADSELLVKQMTGRYKIEHPTTQKFFLQLWNLKLDFKSVSFEAVPREQNKVADAMVNETLDDALTNKGFQTIL
ncbi:MAG: ribonuclease HI family protein [Parcubacteria group bacterium]|nr:ribonuclease HI family protein [Parcubacteria group bacterium]